MAYPRAISNGAPSSSYLSRHSASHNAARKWRVTDLFGDDDYALYLDLPAQAAEQAQTEIWSYCLMPNHVHIIIVPSDDHVVTVAPTLERFGDFRTFLGEEFDEAMRYAGLRRAKGVDRQIGSKEWLSDIEAKTGLTLAPQRPGRR